MVYYAHWQRGSLSKKLIPGAPVKKGDLLALAGSSGQSDQPHLHMQVERLDLAALTDQLEDFDPPTKQKIIDAFGKDQIASLRRPLAFHGMRAVVTAELKPGGVDKNAFGPVTQQGFFFREYAIHPSLPSVCDILREQIKAKQTELDDEAGLTDAGKPTSALRSAHPGAAGAET